MLTPDELALITLPAERIQMRLQADTTRRIAEIIAKHGELTASGQHLLNRLQVTRFNDEYQADIAKYADLTEKEVERIIWEAAERSFNYDKAIFTRKGVPFVPFAENTFMQNLTRAAVELAKETGGITQTKGFMIKDAAGRLQPTEASKFLNQELDRVTLNVTAGTQTYTQSIRQTVTTMKNSGLRDIDYSGGVSNRVDVAVRRAVMTGINKVMLEHADEHARQLGTTFFEITWHSGHRPSHGWGGMRYSDVPTDVIDIQTGKTFLMAEKLFEKYGGGILGEWNCRHNKYPIDEFEPPLYTRSELTKKEQQEKETTPFKGVEYTPYTAGQRMRELEREMRALRAEGMLSKAQYETLRKTASAADLKDLENPYTESRLRYRVLRAEYADFAEMMGLKTQFERVSYDMLGKIF